MMSDLNYRRAKFVYEGARLAAAAAEAPIVPEPYDDREEAFRAQFEKVIERQMGPERSSNAEQLHEDWVKAYEKMGWVYGPVRDTEKKTHPDMVPYNELGHLERDKDAVFVALCEIARKWVHEPGADCDDKQELEKQVAALKAEIEVIETTMTSAAIVDKRREGVVDEAVNYINQTLKMDRVAMEEDCVVMFNDVLNILQSDLVETVSKEDQHE